jgi:cytochrome b subunit of formate dehydrogenase
MTTFQTITILAVAGAAAVLALHFLAAGRRLCREAKAAPRRPLGRWQRLLYAVTILSLLVLVFTGFWPAVRGEPLRGWLLMIHNSAAPAFAIGLLVLAFLWAERRPARLVESPAVEPRQARPARVATGAPGATASATGFGRGQRLVFWAAALLATTLVLTMMFSMVQIFGTPGQELLFEIHRYSALAMVLVAMVHGYLVALARGLGR